MAKLLKPVIILLFVLSIAALGLGFQLFSQREILKGRVTKLQDSTRRVASNIKYSDLNSQQLLDYAAMDSQLRGIEKAAENEHEELVTTKEDLDGTTQELTSTKDTLDQTSTDLSASQSEVERLTDEGRRQQSDIAQKTRAMDSMELAQNELNSQVDQLNRGLEGARAQLLDREREYDDLLKDYTKVVQSLGGGPSAAPDLDPHITGNILVAQPEWNFVVVDLGSASGLPEQAELLVHRDRDLVGRIRITEVQETMSIGQILNAWEVTPVASGDIVIAPGT